MASWVFCWRFGIRVGPHRRAGLRGSLHHRIGAPPCGPTWIIPPPNWRTAVRTYANRSTTKLVHRRAPGKTINQRQ